MSIISDAVKVLALFLSCVCLSVCLSGLACCDVLPNGLCRNLKFSKQIVALSQNHECSPVPLGGAFDVVADLGSRSSGFPVAQ